MPDYAGSSFIGYVPSYSPRSKAALKRIGGGDGYDIMGEDDAAMSPDMDEYIKAAGLARPVTRTGEARSSEGGAPYAIVNGQKIYMTAGGGTSTTDQGSYGWQQSRPRSLDASAIQRSQGFQSWAAQRAADAESRRRREEAAAASQQRLAEAEGMLKLGRQYEDPNAAAIRAMQLRLAEAQAKFQERQTGEALTQRDMRDVNRANSQAQMVQQQIMALESSGDPRKIRQAAALRQQFGQQFAGTDVALPGSTTTEQEAIIRARGALAPRIQAAVEGVVSPLMGREAQAQYQRSGLFGGAFTRNTAEHLSDSEIATVRERLAQEAQVLADETGVPVNDIYREMLKRTPGVISGASFDGTGIQPRRAEEIVGLLRGSWGDSSMTGSMR